MLRFFGGVGLGRCSACRSPGGYYYQSTIDGWPGVWMCDSCVHPDVAHARITQALDRERLRIEDD